MKCLIAYNKNSGKGKVIKWVGHIVERLKTKYKTIDIFESKFKNDIKNHLSYYGFNYDCVVIMGGDGTLHEAINGLMGNIKRPIIGYIPFGTCNDFGRSYNLKKDVIKCINVILTGKTKSIDIFKINSDYFCYGMAIGNLTNISYDTNQKNKKIFGRLAYYFYVLKDMFSDNSFKCNLLLNEEKSIKNCFCLIGIKTKYLASFKIKKDNEKFKIFIVNKTNKLIGLFDLLMLFIIGEKYKHNIDYFESQTINIISDNPLRCNVDGEALPLMKEIKIEKISRAINMFIE